MSWALERWQLSTGAVLGTALGGLVVGLGAVTGPALLLAGTIGLILTGLTLLDLRFGIALITILTFFESLATFGGGVTFVKLVGAIVIVSWLMLAANRRLQMNLLFLDQPLFSYAILVFLGWAAASSVWAAESGAAVSGISRLVLVAALLFVTYSAIGSPRDIRLIFWALVAGALATTLYGFATTLGGEARLVGGIENANALAAALVPAILISIALAATALSGAERTAALVSAVVFGAALFMTNSRGGLVGMAVGLLVALCMQSALRRYAALLVVVFVSLGLMHYAFIATSQERERLANISALSSEGTSGRTDIWNVGLRVARDHPLIGVGLDNFAVVESEYAAGDFGIVQIRKILERVVPHNVYLQLVAELGAVGLLAYCAIALGAFGIGYRAVRRLATAGDWRTATLGHSMLAAFVALLVVFLFHNGLVEKQFWLLTGMLVALSALAARVVPAPTLATDGAAPVVAVPPT